MATLVPLPDQPATPATSPLCPCGLPWTRFVVRDEAGGEVSRSMCFTCGAGVPPQMWAEHRIGELFASSEISGWIIAATFSQVGWN